MEETNNCNKSVFPQVLLLVFCVGILIISFIATQAFNNNQSNNTDNQIDPTSNTNQVETISDDLTKNLEDEILNDDTTNIIVETEQKEVRREENSSSLVTTKIPLDNCVGIDKQSIANQSIELSFPKTRDMQAIDHPTICRHMVQFELNTMTLKIAIDDFGNIYEEHTSSGYERVSLGKHPDINGSDIKRISGFNYDANTPENQYYSNNVVLLSTGGVQSTFDRYVTPSDNPNVGLMINCIASPGFYNYQECDDFVKALKIRVTKN